MSSTLFQSRFYMRRELSLPHRRTRTQLTVLSTGACGWQTARPLSPGPPRADPPPARAGDPGSEPQAWLHTNKQCASDASRMAPSALATTSNVPRTPAGWHPQRWPQQATRLGCQQDGTLSAGHTRPAFPVALFPHYHLFVLFLPVFCYSHMLPT